ncbi:hypothetical protein [Microbacterium sp. MMO-56]|uniref:hypothetical protein n=1 Tax=Microbacterium sp. MMO-56 TaxID=3081281 RepID=UPI00301A80AB
MGITRGRLSIDEHFTAVPNEWARDARLSRRARGLLVEVMSHRIGWHITTRSLAGAGPEGRDAIRSAIDELLEYGYVKRSQSRAAAGKFGEIEYELCDPPTVAGFADRGSAVAGFAVDGESATKKNISSEDHPEEDHQEEIMLIAAVSFEDFWAVWPRKDSKRTALAAWGRAVKKVAPEVVLQAASAYAASPFLPERQFVPYAATWLNGERWNDPLPEAPGSARMGPNDRLRAGMAMGDRLQAEYDAQRGIGA